MESSLTRDDVETLRVIFGIDSEVVGETHPKFLRRNLLRFTFPAGVRWRCNSALMQGQEK